MVLAQHLFVAIVTICCLVPCVADRDPSQKDDATPEQAKATAPKIPNPPDPPKSLAKKTHPNSEQLQHTKLKLLLSNAWKIAAAWTKEHSEKGSTRMHWQDNETGIFGGIHIKPKESEDPARISLEGFVASLHQDDDHPPETDKEWKFAKSDMMKKLGGMTGGRSHAEKRVDDWFTAVFDLGLKMMDARAEQAAEGGDPTASIQPSEQAEQAAEGGDPTASIQPSEHKGLDRHAFVYCWTVAYSMQFVSCFPLVGCWITPKQDEFFGPPAPTDVDTTGPLAKARSKMWMYRTVAGYKDPAKVVAEKAMNKIKEGDVSINLHRFVKFWHSVKAEKLDETKLEAYHRFLVALHNAALKHGWHTSQGDLHGVSFQYMSLLADEFPSEKKHPQKPKYLDQLQLLKDVDEDYPLIA